MTLLNSTGAFARITRPTVPPRLRARVARDGATAYARVVEPLRKVLDQIGARDAYGFVTAGALYAADHADALARAATLDPLSGAVARLLFLGEPCALTSLPDALYRTVDRLETAGLLVREGGTVRTDGWIVVVANRGYLIVGIPPAYPAAVTNASRAYLGFDSIILAGMMPSVVGRTILDLGAGCGLHGLLAADGAKRAVLTEIDEGALEIARFNHALNEVAHPVEFRLGDAYEPVAGQRFDLITTLAPYVLSVPGAESSTVYAGGRDGLDVLRPFIAGASDHLAPGGEFIAIAQLLCDGDGPILARELDGLAPDLDATMTYDVWHPLQPYIVELAGRLAAHGSPLSTAQLIERYRTSLRLLGATGVATVRLRLTKPTSARHHHRPVIIVGRFLEIAGTDSYALAPGTTLSRDGAVPLLINAGSVNPIDPATAALVDHLVTGTIADAVDAAWGATPIEVHIDLVDQAIRRLRDLADAGLVARVDPLAPAPMAPEAQAAAAI